MGKKRIIELYDVDDTRATIGLFQSETPFMSVSKGDFFDPRMLEEFISPGSYQGMALQVVAVTHLFWCIDDAEPTQKILIYLKSIPGKEYERIIRGEL